MMTKLKQLWAAVRLSRYATSEAGDRSGIREAAILHIDIVGSTRLVDRDLELAHRRIRQLYARLCRISGYYHGLVRELRGDAAVVEFTCAGNAIRAALAIQATNGLLNKSRIGKINPDIRSGISFGSIISEDRMITGLPVIRAQRIEQLAEPGTVLFDQSVYERIGESSDFEISEVGMHGLKGFDECVGIYRASSSKIDFPGAFSAQLESLPNAC